MLHIYVDGDACPVKEEVIRVATRHDLEVTIVSNGGVRPRANPKIHIVVVEAGADSADDWIVTQIATGDIAITADILLADRCLKKGAHVIGHSGRPFTPENIGNMIAGRSIGAHLREMGVGSTGQASFSKNDRSQFLQALEVSVQAVKRAVNQGIAGDQYV
jgi:uncharacterized protein YaiI (UPF0178 family)